MLRLAEAPDEFCREEMVCLYDSFFSYLLDNVAKHHYINTHVNLPHSLVSTLTRRERPVSDVELFMGQIEGKLTRKITFGAWK